MATIDPQSFEINIFELSFRLKLEVPVSRELIIAAFETYGLLVYREGAVGIIVGLCVDPIGPEYIRATWELSFKY